MLTLLKKFIKDLLGPVWPKIRPLYHGSRGYLGAAFYRFPAQELQLIGITGTKGKTTTAVFTGRLLNLSGLKTGYLSSAIINLGEFELSQYQSSFNSSGEKLNTFKMSTLDPWLVQKYLRQMVQRGCQAAVLEMTSQGLESHRHYGLNGFNVGVFLNLYPEHLDAHGGWEQYKQAKAILFQNIRSGGTAILNSASQEFEFMLATAQKSGAIIKSVQANHDYRIMATPSKIEKVLEIDGIHAQTNFVADFEVSNLVFALEIVRTIQKVIKPEQLIPQIFGVPGRMEWVVKYGNVLYNPAG